MPHDGLPVRADPGARAAVADRVAAAHVTTTSAPRTTRRLAAFGAVTAALIVAACGSTSGSGAVSGATGTPLASSGTGASASASAEASAGASGALNQGFLTFQEQNASKVFGGGTITDLGDGSSAVTLGIVAVGYADPLPARLVSGACTDAAAAPLPSYAPLPSAEASGAASPEASAAPSAAASADESAPAESGSPAPATLPVELTPVQLGGSNTVVQIGLSDILASPSSVLVYKSQAEPTLVACSDVTNTLVLPSSAPAASAEASTEASLPAASASTTP